jgi:hypothetical protein
LALPCHKNCGVVLDPQITLPLQVRVQIGELKSSDVKIRKFDMPINDSVESDKKQTRGVTTVA